MQQGIIYKKTGNRSRGQLASYHQKPNPLKLNKTPFRVDVACLKPIEQRNAITFDALNNEFKSKYTIGMEVEKNELHRGAVKEYELFCGFERDSSCGYEAVTHILPLLPAGLWRTKVYDMMHKAEKIIDDKYSRSDDKYDGQYTCGGHITIAVDGITGDELREVIRKHCGIIMAIFRNRLKNKYCGHNLRMISKNEVDNGAVSVNNCGRCGMCNYGNGWHSKYQMALVKGNVLEFRLVSKFESVKQMMRRYELFYEVVNFAVTNPNGSHDVLIKKLMPTLISMYNGDTAKVQNVVDLSKHFRKFILTGAIHEDIKKFVSR
jgi:hypothetical protein